MKRFIGVILVIVLVGIAGNDVWRWATAQQHLTSVTDDLATRAADGAGNGLTREQVGSDLVAVATPQGVTVYQYGQTEQGVQVWTEARVPGTIVAGPFSALLMGKSFAEARKTVLVIRDYQTAGVH